MGEAGVRGLVVSSGVMSLPLLVVTETDVGGGMSSNDLPKLDVLMMEAMSSLTGNGVQ